MKYLIIVLSLYLSACAGGSGEQATDPGQPKVENPVDPDPSDDLGVELSLLCQEISSSYGLYAYYDPSNMAGVSVYTDQTDCQNHAPTWYDMPANDVTDDNFDAEGFPNLVLTLTVDNGSVYLLATDSI